MMEDRRVALITGARKGIGRHLSEVLLGKGYIVVGCSRTNSDLIHPDYHHYLLDVSDEKSAKELFRYVNSKFNRLDILINNAGIASMNHSMLTTVETVKKIFSTNVIGMFIFCREAAKIMSKNNYGRIVNFSTIAVPLKLEGESIYAASKSAVNSLTQILAAEFAGMGITVNAIGPTPVKTDLIRNIPESKMSKLISRLVIKRFGEFSDIDNVVDFFHKT